MTVRLFWADRRECVKDQTGDLSIQFGLEFAKERFSGDKTEEVGRVQRTLISFKVILILF